MRLITILFGCIFVSALSYGQAEINNKQEITSLQSPFLPTIDECGTHIGVLRNDDGPKTLPHEFPWVVLLRYLTKDGNKIFGCGGTIISKRYILTGAHCVKGQYETSMGKVISVRIGEYNLTKEVREGENLDCTDRNCQEIAVEKIIPHENFDVHHDIALIRLKEDIVFNDMVKPICLPNKDQIIVNSETQLWMGGWGIIEEGKEFKGRPDILSMFHSFKRSDVPLKVKVQSQPMSVCQKKYGNITEKIELDSKIQICAGGGPDQDSCNSEFEGGPLMTPYLGFKGDVGTIKLFQVGIYSFSMRPCDEKGYPPVYTNVNAFTDWITSNLY